MSNDLTELERKVIISLADDSEPFEQIWLYMNSFPEHPEDVCDRQQRLATHGPKYSMAQVAELVKNVLYKGYIVSLDYLGNPQNIDNASPWQDPWFDFAKKGKEALKKVLDERRT